MKVLQSETHGVCLHFRPQRSSTRLSIFWTEQNEIRYLHTVTRCRRSENIFGTERRKYKIVKKNTVYTQGKIAKTEQKYNDLVTVITVRVKLHKGTSTVLVSAASRAQLMRFHTVNPHTRHLTTRAIGYKSFARINALTPVQHNYKGLT